MKSLDHFPEVYLYKKAVDMRKFRNGLCAIVQQEMQMNVFTDGLFIFTNRRGNIIRFLYWDDTGVCCSKAIHWMRDGPSESPCSRGFQTGTSC